MTKPLACGLWETLPTPALTQGLSYTACLRHSTSHFHIPVGHCLLQSNHPKARRLRAEWPLVITHFL